MASIFKGIFSMNGPLTSTSVSWCSTITGDDAASVRFRQSSDVSCSEPWLAAYAAIALSRFSPGWPSIRPVRNAPDQVGFAISLSEG
jgi:hypothetical protein